MTRIWALLMAAGLLAGCATGGYNAPVQERGASMHKYGAKAATKKRSTAKDARPRVHIVEKGDTMYSIAFNYGFDYHELAEMNGIQDPSLIQIGQQINLFPGATMTRPAATVTTQPLPPVVAAKPLIKDQPKVVKYAYSEAAVAQAEGRTQQVSPPAPVVARVETKVAPAPAPVSKPAAEGDDDALEWSMPTQGKLVGTFSESDNRKGIDVAGKLGQPVFASAPGKVVYSGSGLRGYGKLLIVKHNNTYLSAYAHNDQLLVKEGQTVMRGQKIAEMGNSDSDQVKLHFEVRRFGKPVDPADYLPI